MASFQNPDFQPAHTSVLKLKQRIQSGEVPTVSEWARKEGITRVTARKCFKELQAGRILEKGKNGRYYPKGATPSIESKPQARKAASSNAYTSFLNDILEETWEWQSRLPKQSWLSQKYGVSNHTIGTWCVSLLEKGLLYQRGRFFFVGKVIDKPIRRASSPIIILYIQSMSHWTWDLINMRIGPFARTLNDLCATHGIRLYPAVDTLHRSNATPDILIGMNSISAKIEEWGDRFLGTILNKAEITREGLNEWYSTLSHHNKPVVFFDRKGLDIQNPSSAKKSYRKTTPFYRCAFSEYNFSTKALRYLVEQGHRNILLAPARPVWWDLRKKLIVEEAEKNFPSVRVTACPQLVAENFIGNKRSELIDTIQKLKKALVPRLQKLEAEILKDADKRGKSFPRYYAKWKSIGEGAATLAYIESRTLGNEVTPANSVGESARLALDFVLGGLGVKDNKPSAIIVPNDKYAGECLHVLKLLGYSIPDDMSLISFDNQENVTIGYVSTVDPGFRELARQAIHAILGDIPTRADKNGVITSRPVVVDRGTVKQM